MEPLSARALTAELADDLGWLRELLADWSPDEYAELGELLTKLSRALLGEDADRAGALFITVDPERDTPDILKTYLENFDSRIIGLTGDPPTTEAIAKAFRVYAKKVPGEKSGDYTVDHTGVVYLMDRRGKFVSAFNLQRPPQQAARELEAYL